MIKSLWGEQNFIHTAETFLKHAALFFFLSSTMFAGTQTDCDFFPVGKKVWADFLIFFNLNVNNVQGNTEQSWAQCSADRLPRKLDTHQLSVKTSSGHDTREEVVTDTILLTGFFNLTQRVLKSRQTSSPKSEMEHGTDRPSSSVMIWIWMWVWSCNGLVGVRWERLLTCCSVESLTRRLMPLFHLVQKCLIKTWH